MCKGSIPHNSFFPFFKPFKLYLIFNWRIITVLWMVSAIYRQLSFYIKKAFLIMVLFFYKIIYPMSKILCWKNSHLRIHLDSIFLLCLPCNQMQSVCLGLFSLLVNQVNILAAKWLRPSKAQHYGLICFYWTKLLRPWFLPVQNDMKHRNPFGDICKSLFRAIAYFMCQDNCFLWE